MAQANCVPNVAITTTQDPTNQDPLHTEQEAAKYLRMGLSTLRRKRKAGTGPKYKQDGHIIRYRRSWLDAWLNGQPVQAE
jgi:excisionase family DNA binding protein